MNTSAHTPQEEMTTLDNQTAQIPPTFVSDTKVAEETKQRPVWVFPTSAAGAGFVLGVGGVLMARMLTPSAQAAVPGQEFTLAELMTDGNLEVAHSVTDNMTFAEAFAAARSEAGAGAIFTWHGNVYSTFTEAEWNAMTADEQAEYAGHFNWEGADQVHQDSVAEADEVIVVEDQHVKTVAVLHDDESGANIAVMNITDHDAVLVDADGDGVMDYMAADANQDGQFTPEEVVDLHQADIEITTEDVIGLMDADVLPEA